MTRCKLVKWLFSAKDFPTKRILGLKWLTFFQPSSVVVMASSSYSTKLRRTKKILNSFASSVQEVDSSLGDDNADILGEYNPEIFGEVNPDSIIDFNGNDDEEDLFMDCIDSFDCEGRVVNDVPGFDSAVCSEEDIEEDCSSDESDTVEDECTKLAKVLCEFR